MQAFRIADRRRKIFDGTGARLFGGRWNNPGQPVIYAAETYAGALLEILVHANIGRIPKTHAAVEIHIPDDLAFARFDQPQLLDWSSVDDSVSRSFGDRWLEEKRYCLLLVPSAVTRGREHNLLINPEHPDFARITCSEPQDVLWDDRLFLRSQSAAP
jgi:RES domain-containing protein